MALTKVYNVLSAIRHGKALTAAERDVHDAGRISILRDLHDRLDAAVAAAYGWPADLDGEAGAARVLALNAERAAEEAAGFVRWLRPGFQAPEETRRRTVQTVMEVAEAAGVGPRPWPKDPAAQFILLRSALGPDPASPQDIARRFKGAPKGGKVGEMLQALAALGQARRLDDDRYAP